MFNGLNLIWSYKIAVGAIILVLVAGGLYLLWNLPVNFQTDRLALVISRNRNQPASLAEEVFDENENLKNGIEVITPNGDEEWQRGGQYNVSWSSTLDGDVALHVILVPSDDIGKAIFNPSIFPEGVVDGSYTFSVPNNIVPGKYHIMILGGVDCKIENAENCYLDISDRPFIIR